MTLTFLNDRKTALEASLKQIEQSFHIVTGHLAEVAYQMSELTKIEENLSKQDVCVIEGSDIQ
jgi:hypothetical protein